MAFQSSHCIDPQDATFIVTATGHSNSSGGGKAKVSHAKRHVTLTRCGAGSFRGTVARSSCVLMRSTALTCAGRSGAAARSPRARSRFLKISHGSFGGNTEEAGQIRSGATLGSREGGRWSGGGDAAAFLARPWSDIDYQSLAATTRMSCSTTNSELPQARNCSSAASSASVSAGCTPGGGLIEHVHHTKQVGAYLGCEPQALHCACWRRNATRGGARSRMVRAYGDTDSR